MSTKTSEDRSEYHLGEEIANTLSHGIGLVASLVAVPFLLIASIRSGNPSTIVGAAVFAATMITLYSASTLYHGLRHEGAKRIFRLLDHTAIFLLIAGTYTPFTLGVMRGPWGWTLLAVVWSLAVLGITLKAVPATRHSRISLILYVAMGWLAMVAIRPLVAHVPLSGIAWILAGGLAYTGGLIFYGMRVRYSHTVWHLFVIAGTVCHFFAVLWYAS
jgi:hemolysin III